MPNTSTGGVLIANVCKMESGCVRPCVRSTVQSGGRTAWSRSGTCRLYFGPLSPARPRHLGTLQKVHEVVKLPHVIRHARRREAASEKLRVRPSAPFRKHEEALQDGEKERARNRCPGLVHLSVRIQNAEHDRPDD